MPNKSHDIGTKSSVQINWEQNGPINDQLRDVFTPMNHLFVEMVSNDLAHSYISPEERVANTGNAYVLPSGRITTLPPTLFGKITEYDATPNECLTVPNKADDRSLMVENYTHWATGIAATKYRSRFPNREILLDTMEKLEGQAYPREDWWLAATALQKALRDDVSFTIDLHRCNRIVNAGFDYDELDATAQKIFRQHPTYSLVMSRIEGGDRTWQGTRDYAQLPIGQYGTEASAKLARVTTLFNDRIKSSHAMNAKVNNLLSEETTALLASYTARSRERKQDNVHNFALHGAKNTLTEGILSVSQTLAFLTAEKIEGFESHDQLVAKILDSDIIEQFTRIVRPGFIGPATLAGLYMPGVLIVKENNQLGLSKQAIDVLSSMRKEFVADIVAQWATYRASEDPAAKRPPALGLVCPAAAPKGIISEAKEAFKLFYQNS